MFRRSRIFPACMLLAGIWIISAAPGCTKDVGRPVAADTDVPVTPVRNEDSCTTNVKYSNRISKIVSASCAIEGCHVSSGYKDLSAYALLKAEIDAVGTSHFLKRIRPGGGMPPDYSTGPALTACDIKSIEVWLEAGGKGD